VDINNLLFILKAKDEASAVVDHVKGSVTGLGAAHGTAKAIIGAFSGAVGSGLVGALSDAARAAAEDEANVAKLRASVEASGGSWTDYEGQINNVIAAGQALAFSDTETRDALSIMTAQTGSTEEAMARLATAQDLARGTGMSLESAARLLGKTSDENINVFKRYGVNLDANATAQEVLAAVQSKFSGQAAAYGSTTQAWIFKVKDAIGEWTESIGASLGPAQGLIALLPGVSSGMTIAGSAVGGLSSLIKGPMISSFLATIPATLAMMAPFLPLILVIAAIGAAIFILKMAWEGNWGDIQGKTQAAINFIRPLLNWFSEIFGSIGGWLRDLVAAFQQAFSGDLSGIVDKLLELFFGLPAKFVSIGENIIRGIAQGLGNLKTWLWNQLISSLAGMVDAAKSFLHISSPSAVMAGVGANMALGLMQGYERNLSDLPLPSIGGMGGGGGVGGIGAGGIYFAPGSVVVNGNLIGIDDLRREIVGSVRDAVQGGGFRGIIPSVKRDN
jgi:hypothetical protein